MKVKTLPSGYDGMGSITCFEWRTDRYAFAENACVAVAPDGQLYDTAGYFQPSVSPHLDFTPFTPAEQIEIADYMLDLWGKYRERAVGMKAGEAVKDLAIYGELYLDAQNEAHFICHTKDDDFQRTKTALQKFIVLLEDQINRAHECPYYKKPNLK